MQKELEAGSWKVIAEAREGGNVGICNETEVMAALNPNLIDEITKSVL